MGTCGFHDKFSDDEDNPRQKTDMDPRTVGKENPTKLKNITRMESVDDFKNLGFQVGTPARDSLRPMCHKGAETLCRFRPFNANEDGVDQCVQYGDIEADYKRNEHWDLVEEDNEWDILTKQETICEVHTPKSIATGKTYDFEFDRLFPPQCRNINVYNILRNQWFPILIGGMSVGVIPYGVSGSGKSHTVHGTRAEPGIVPLFCKDLFHRLKTSYGHLGFTNTVRVQFLEIYDNKVVDLLQERLETGRVKPNTPLDPKRGLAVRSQERSFSSAPVQDALDLEVKDKNELLDAFWKGYIRLRREKVIVGSVKRLSSRSHSIFICTIKREHKESGTITSAQFFAVDLAGPFKASELGGVKDKRVLNRLNQSLFAFRKVMLFSDTKSTGRHKPYRDSKVTRIIRSLLEKGKTSIMLNVSGATQSARKTIETLRFGLKASQLAKKIITPNVTLSSSLFNDKQSSQEDLYLGSVEFVD